VFVVVVVIGTYRPGNSVDDFKAAFRHVVYLFKGMNAPFVYQLAYNSGNPRDDKTPFINMYPGDDVVDMVSTVYPLLTITK
jgi:beta-mannanase